MSRTSGHAQDAIELALVYQAGWGNIPVKEGDHA